MHAFVSTDACLPVNAYRKAFQGKVQAHRRLWRCGKRVQRVKSSLRQGHINSLSLHPGLGFSMCISLQRATCEQPCTCVPVRIWMREPERGGVSDGEDESMSQPRVREQGLVHLSVFSRCFASGSRLRVFYLTGMGDFYEDNKSKLPHQPCTPYKTKTRTLGATCICPWDRDGLRQRYSFQVLTSSKAIKIFVQPLLRDFVILPSKPLLCNAFLKLLKLSRDRYQEQTPARLVRGAGSPLGGIATLAVQGGESAFVRCSTSTAGACICIAVESVFIFSALVIHL